MPFCSHALALFVLVTALARSFAPFSKASHEITLGWKWEVAPHGVLEIDVVENLVTFDNSADFGIHAGFTQRFYT